MKNYILRYLKSILSETTILITGIFGFSLGFIIPAIPWFKNVNSLLLGGTIVILCFFIAHMMAIIKLLKRNDSLERKIKELNTDNINFEININPHGINFRQDEEHIKTEIEWASKELKDVRDLNNPNYSGAVNITRLLESFALGKRLSEDDIMSYLTEVKKLNKFLNELNKYKFFILNTEIKNIGNYYDEDILIKIKTKNAKFVTRIELDLVQLEEMPSRPSGGLNIPLPAVRVTPIFDFGKNEIDIYLSQDRKMHIRIPSLHIRSSVEVKENEILLAVDKEVNSVDFSLEIITKRTRTPVVKEKSITLK